MDIMRELDGYEETGDYSELKTRLGEDSVSKVGAILRILEIGKPNIAHSKLLLHVCESMLEKCSLTFGTTRDDR